MKVKILIISLFFCASTYAQVGIGTQNPHPSSVLDVTSTSKGFLPPRVALTSLTDVLTIANPVAGLFVYNTSFAGTTPSQVYPGLYYFNGAKWQRVVNQEAQASVEFNQTTPTTSGVQFSPNIQNDKAYVYVSTVDSSQWIYNGTQYVSYTPPSQTAWYRQNSTNDAGNSKTTGIYREGNIGIGPTAFAPTAKLDLRSNTAGGGLRLVDGTQGENKVLSSDVNGNASWATNVAITPAVLGTLVPVNGQVSQNTYTGASITLPNGKWSVQVNMLTICHLQADNIWTRTGFSTSTTVNEMASGSAFIGPTLISALIHGYGVLNMLSGTVIINNTTGGDVTYYYWLLASDNTTTTYTGFANSGAGENSIVAYPMN